MKTIIAGGRDITDEKAVFDAIVRSGFMHEIAEVVSGCAEGVDTLGERFAAFVGVPVVQFPANWRLFGASAGPIRNTAMAKYADALILVWDGTSTGSASMFREATAAGLRIYQEIINGKEESRAERRHADVAQHEGAAHRPALPQAAPSHGQAPR